MAWRYCLTGHDLRYKDDGHFGYRCARCHGTCTNAFTVYGRELCLCGDTPGEHLLKRGYDAEELVRLGVMSRVPAYIALDSGARQGNMDFTSQVAIKWSNV